MTQCLVDNKLPYMCRQDAGRWLCRENAYSFTQCAWQRISALEALLAAVQVQARMDLQAMKAERDAAQHLECAVAGMLRETEVALAAVKAERDAALANADRLAYELQIWVNADGGDAWVWPESARRTALINSREALAAHDLIRSRGNT